VCVSETRGQEKPLVPAWPEPPLTRWSNSTSKILGEKYRCLRTFSLIPQLHWVWPYSLRSWEVAGSRDCPTLKCPPNTALAHNTQKNRFPNPITRLNHTLSLDFGRNTYERCTPVVCCLWSVDDSASAPSSQRVRRKDRKYNRIPLIQHHPPHTPTPPTTQSTTTVRAPPPSLCPHPDWYPIEVTRLKREKFFLDSFRSRQKSSLSGHG